MPAPPRARIALLYILNTNKISSPSGRAFDELMEASSKYHSSTKHAFFQVYQKCLNKGLIKIFKEGRNTYEIEITEVGKNYFQKNFRYIPDLKTIIDIKQQNNQEVDIAAEEDTSCPEKIDVTSSSNASNTKIIFSEDSIEVAKHLIKILTDLVGAAEENDNFQNQQLILQNDNNVLRLELESTKEELERLKILLVKEQTRSLERLERIKGLEKVDAVSKPINHTSKSLKLADLPKIWRPLAKKALEQGWVIEYTRGNHIKWKSPNSTFYISSKTPSDTRSIKNTQAELVKLGLKL